MERKEATRILREIMGECKGLLFIKHVSLLPIEPKNTEKPSRYKLRISCEVNDNMRKTIKAVLSKHKLAIKESGELVVIYRPQNGQ
jgi:hypothetical protein